MAVPVIVESEVIQGKSLRSQTCGMEYNASVVKAMTATLYDYKIEAVVREYSTNITDSHTDAGFPEKKGFVHVPTKVEPYIEFVDYGVGMTEEDVYNIFTVLGCSTKRGDNSTNGSLGFGSKAYAAVADQMTVTSVRDGVKVVVVCYKNKFGELAADLKSKTTTQENNGTVVSIPVDLSKVTEWQRTCAKVLGAFRIPHEVNTFGIYQKDYDDINEVCESIRKKGYVFLSNPPESLQLHRSNTLVLMGDVLYHLPSFQNLVGNTSLKNTVCDMVDCGVYITHFNIGELDHAPSREAISYDQQTLWRVKQRVNHDIKKEYRKFSEELNLDFKETSLYKFYHNYKTTAVWNILKDYSYTFTNNRELRRVDPSNKSCWFYERISPLSWSNRIRGLVPSITDNIVFSYEVQALDQERILAIKDPIIVYSNKEKGLYKMKETLQNIYDARGAHTLYAESKRHADELHTWFGCGEVLCGDSYSPEKTARKVSKRESFGIKEDYETVARTLTLKENDYTLKQEKVNLLEQGVYFAEDTEIILKVVKGYDSALVLDSTRTCNLLKMCGVNKVIFLNKNNQNKIKRSGIKSVNEILVNFVKQRKEAIIKYSVWSEVVLPVSGSIRLLARNTKQYQKLQSKLVVSSLEFETITSVGMFGLNNTKAYKKQLEIKNKLIDSITQEAYNLKDKLPLLDKFCDLDMEDLQYYLRLEKVIK